MSFGFRDKDRPSLRDRFRGKSGDQILEELRKKLDKDKEMFFDRVPNPPSFRRAGFPFDDDGLRSRGRPDFRHRLEELAQQHPEFADSLRPWYDEQPAGHQPAQPAHQPGDAAGPAFRQRTGSNSSQHQQQQQHYQPEPQHHQQQQAEAHADGPQPGLAHHGLRNTVDLGEAQAKQMESEEERGKRAQSAPPAAEPGQQQRFVTRLDVHPQAGEQQGAASKPPAGPKQQQQQPQPAGKASAGNVRQIPIFVEGRDEPVLARDDVDSSAANFGGGFPPHPQPHAGRSSPFGHQGFSRPHMGFPSFHGRDGFEQEAPAHKRPFPQQHHQPPPPPTRQQQQHQQQQQPPRQRTPPQQQQPQPQHPKPQAPPQQQQHQPPPPPPPQQQKPVDALDKVRAVQEEVESLSKQVDEFTGTRNDKQYLFLDEMLTRELIKLDVIETEGRDDVRAARKETIRNIQQCISRLEAKSGAKQEDAAESASSSEAMEVESSQQPSSESMEVDPASSQPSSQTVGDSKTEALGANEAASTPAPAAATATATPAQPETEVAATEQATSSSDCQTAAPKQGMDAVPTPVAATPTPADAASAPPAATSS